MELLAVPCVALSTSFYELGCVLPTQLRTFIWSSTNCIVCARLAVYPDRVMPASNRHEAYKNALKFIQPAYRCDETSASNRPSTFAESK